MKPEHTEHLITQYPLLYRNGMYFECSDGWFDLIDRLSKQLEPLIEKQKVILKDTNDENILPCALQVKEKYGELRFYMSFGTDEMHKPIEQSTQDSRSICERCGEPGKMVKERGWITTLCPRCR
jgi:hypothetical protein